MAHGCLTSEHPDDVHLFQDLHALVQVGPRDVATGPSGAGRCSSHRFAPARPLIFLNVSMGDQAVVERRACGCPLESLGWTTHLHSIRSFEKLTSGGMTFLDTDLARVLDEVLPGRFGGGPTDYQLLEEEDADGAPSVRLLVHPAVGPLNAEAVADVFLAALGRQSGAERAMELHWRATRMLRVERRPPLATTTTGKVLHLHQWRRDRPARVPAGN